MAVLPISRRGIGGEYCTLGQNVNLGPGVRVGNGVKTKTMSRFIRGDLEDQVFCGPSAVFTNDRTPRPYPKGGPGGYLPTLVREGATIGANATILSGLTIGRWAMVAAGAVVTKDVPCPPTGGGHPGPLWLGLPLRPPAGPEFHCPPAGGSIGCGGRSKAFQSHNGQGALGINRETAETLGSPPKRRQVLQTC